LPRFGRREPVGARYRILEAAPETSVTGDGTSAGEKLAAYSERMERLLDEMDGLKEDLKELKIEIKNDGFNVRALSKLVTIRRNKWTAEIAAALMNDLVLYAHATGTPLDLVAPDETPDPSRHRQAPGGFGSRAEG
jgi:uncharacterized protein (UPF0335 family)